VARKHIAWYSKRQPGGAAFRASINRVESLDEQLRKTHAFFDQLVEKQELAA